MYKNITFFCIIITCLIFSCPTAMAADRFTDNGDGTVTDHKLGLMWSKADNQGDINWKHANAWAKYTFGDTISSRYDNWRLPTLEELQSLYVTDSKYNGYMTDCGFMVKIFPKIKLSCILLWTSEKSTGAHVAFNFAIGNSFAIPAYDVVGCRGLPVRSLKNDNFQPSKD
ncbi:MAG: DUF1566 domain-containing protein [Deltaproteobacteria bacterium]|nr:DUF1566 domain-containing protein [Deltaproteobacteria bacterium]